MAVDYMENAASGYATRALNTPNKTASYVGNALDQVQRDTAFARIDETFKCTQELCNRVSILAERIAGSITQQAGKEGPVPPDNGLFALVRSSATRTHSSVMDAIAEIARIERELP